MHVVSMMDNVPMGATVFRSVIIGNPTHLRDSRALTMKMLK